MIWFIGCLLLAIGCLIVPVAIVGIIISYRETKKIKKMQQAKREHRKRDIG